MLQAVTTQDSGPGSHPGNSQVAASPSAGMISTHRPSTTLCPDGGQRRHVVAVWALGAYHRAGLGVGAGLGGTWLCPPPTPPTVVGSLYPEGGLGVEHVEPVLVERGEGPFHRLRADTPRPPHPPTPRRLPGTSACCLSSRSPCA